MISIDLQHFEDSVSCHFLLYSSIETFHNITYNFRGGNIYGLISDYGCGSWGLATTLGGRCCNPSGDIFLNQEKTNNQQLASMSCFIAENNFPEELGKQITTKEWIEKGLTSSNQPYTPLEIKNLFRLSNERFNRPIDQSSGEIWNISTAVGFAAGKQIFCFPWLNERNLFRVDVMYETGILKLLKKHNKIVLIPTYHGKQIRKYCDVQILFKKAGYQFKT